MNRPTSSPRTDAEGRTDPGEGSITPDVLQRWQTELQTFFAATRGRLQRLHAMQPAARPTDPPAEPALPQQDRDPSPAAFLPTGSPEARQPPEPQQPPEARQPPEPRQPTATPADGQEPEHRLQELKRRLAAQLAGQ